MGVFFFFLTYSNLLSDLIVWGQSQAFRFVVLLSMSEYELILIYLNPEPESGRIATFIVQ